mgnify:CR=1 FL=1
MKFLVDNQLPARLAQWLTDKVCEATHVLDLGMEKSSDKEIWARAMAVSRVVVSIDEDFLYLANEATGGQSLWLRVGNCRTQVLIAWLEKAWPQVEAALALGDSVVEVL